MCVCVCVYIYIYVYMYVQMHLQTALCYMYTKEIIFYTIFKIEHKLYIASVSAPTPRQ